MIRLRLQRRLFVDDAFLFLGLICLCASVGLIWRSSYGIFAQTEAFDRFDTIAHSTWGLDRFGGVYIIVTYITIYFIKLSFLFFFRILVRRDRKMTIYWWTVLAIIIVTLCVSIIIVVFPLCTVFPTPHGTVEFFKLCSGMRS